MPAQPYISNRPSVLQLTVTAQSPVVASGGNVTIVVDVYNPLVF